VADASAMALARGILAGRHDPGQRARRGARAVLTKAHQRLHCNRGAAVAVARANVGGSVSDLFGRGNIAATIWALMDAKGFVHPQRHRRAIIPSCVELEYPCAVGAG